MQIGDSKSMCIGDAMLTALRRMMGVRYAGGMPYIIQVWGRVLAGVLARVELAVSSFMPLAWR